MISSAHGLNSTDRPTLACEVTQVQLNNDDLVLTTVLEPALQYTTLAIDNKP